MGDYSGNQMASKVTFRSYSPAYKQHCLGIFDCNCPEFFSPNERADYERFLDANPINYEVCCIDSMVVGAYGLIGNDSQSGHLNWILLNAKSQGAGIGSAMMERIMDAARTLGLRCVRIAASHKSAPFFAKFGAIAIESIDHGWGPGMHRINMALRLIGDSTNKA
jgi:GNAT superfamily N-acetyltransferase